MERSSQIAARFIRELSELTDCLAARDIVVGSLRADYSAFGGWVLVAQKHHEAVRFTWDGRDGFLTVEGSPMPDGSAPRDWKQELVKGFDRPSGAYPVPFVAEYLQKRFPI
jgi:alkylated DNA repair dioxygenase AlkB